MSRSPTAFVEAGNSDVQTHFLVASMQDKQLTVWLGRQRPVFIGCRFFKNVRCTGNLDCLLTCCYDVEFEGQPGRSPYDTVYNL